MHLHTVCVEYSERLPTRLNPLAERASFSQVTAMTARARGLGLSPGFYVNNYQCGGGDCQVELYPIVTSQYSSTTSCQVSFHIQ